MEEVYRYFASKSKGLELSDKEIAEQVFRNWSALLNDGVLTKLQLYLRYPKWLVDKFVDEPMTEREILREEKKIGHIFPRVDFNKPDNKKFYFENPNLSYGV